MNNKPLGQAIGHAVDQAIGHAIGQAIDREIITAAVWRPSTFLRGPLGRLFSFTSPGSRNVTTARSGGDPFQKPGRVVKGEGHAVLALARAAVEDELHPIAGLKSKCYPVVAIDAKAGGSPFDLLRNVAIRRQNDVPDG